MKYTMPKGLKELWRTARRYAKYATLLTGIKYRSTIVSTYAHWWNTPSRSRTKSALLKEITFFKKVIKKNISKIIKEARENNRWVIDIKYEPIYREFRPTGSKIIKRGYNFLEWEVCPDRWFESWGMQNPDLAKNNIKYHVLNFRKLAAKYITRRLSLAPWELLDIRNKAIEHAERAEYLINNPTWEKEPDYNTNVHWRYITPFKSFYW